MLFFNILIKIRSRCISIILHNFTDVSRYNVKISKDLVYINITLLTQLYCIDKNKVISIH